MGESSPTSHGVRQTALATVLPAFVEASALHVGAAAGAASLRAALVENGRMSDAQFNQSFAVARLTPGTNLLALYALLGFHLASWRGAISTLAVGAVVPAMIATAIAAAYLAHAQHPWVARAMDGARAGALAVFAWAIVRLTRPVLRDQVGRGALFAAIVTLVALSGYIPAILLLVGSGIAGSIVLGRKA